MNIDRVTAEFNSCFWEHPDAVTLVWEDEDRHQSNLWPKHVGCSVCGQMRTIG